MVYAAMRDRAITVLFQSPDLTFGRFDCAPDDARWSRINCTDEGHFVVFPGSPVRISQEGRDSVVADPNRVIFYNRGQTYRRSLVSPDGDHSIFVLVSPALLESFARERFPRLGDPERAPFSRTESASRAGEYLVHGVLAAQAGAGAGDALQIEERLIELLECALTHLFAERPAPRAERTSTMRLRAELVEETKAVIGARIGDELTLGSLAAEVATSKYHLARVFRSMTGRSIHAYRDEVTARLGLRAVAHGEESITRIAVDLGYSSLSHFSDRFRRVFGASPSSVRGWSRRPSTAELSNFLKGAPEQAA
jgi:AraC family transcriptional regulator